MTDPIPHHHSILLGLIGAPIRHSASPAMHEAAASAVGLRGCYRLIEVADADAPQLNSMLDGIRFLGFSGVNITYPYKEAVLPLLDEVDAEAAAIGAVNTVTVGGKRLIGHNTDATGFARACRDVVGSVAGQTVCLVGAGGAGKAIAFALAGMGVARLAIHDRDASKAEALARALEGRVAAMACTTPAEGLAGANGLVNATPVGMLPSRDTPVPPHLLRRDLWVADAVYWPLWTPLLQAARETGAKVMTGRELAIHQALDAFKLFTGLAAPREAMSTAFDAVIAARGAMPLIA